MGTVTAVARTLATGWAYRIPGSLVKGAQEFERLMLAIAKEPIHIFLDFNAVIVNLQNLPGEQQRMCLEKIRKSVMHMKGKLEENIRQKEHVPTIPAAGMAVLRQQYMLIQAVEDKCGRNHRK